MKRFYILLLVLFTFFNANKAKSQDQEIGLILGVTEYLGDLTYSHVDWQESKFGFGALYRYYFSPRVNFKGGVYLGWVSGYDQDGQPDESGRPYGRNLSFKSHVFDATAQIEYNILPFISGNRTRFWSPYVFAGISVFNFNPKTEYQGDMIELQPLGTQGQNTGLPGYEGPYNLTQFSIPYGFGIKYSFRNATTSSGFNMYLWNIGVYVSQNKTFTDMLDDVGGKYPDFTKLDGGVNGLAAKLSDRGPEIGSPPRTAGGLRGNPDENDAYMWIGFTISRTLRGGGSCYCF
jgi:hypothetical protein